METTKKRIFGLNESLGIGFCFSDEDKRLMAEDGEYYLK